MTGAYVRVIRDGRWQNIEFDQLTDEELDAFEARTRDLGTVAGEGWKWAKFLAKWIRDNVSEGGKATIFIDKTGG
jgi:hypothetical protein